MESAENPELVPESQQQLDNLKQPGETNDAGQNVNFDQAATLWPPYCNPNYVMPDIIEVKVNVGMENYFFPVQIVKAAKHKLYLGGYRNKLNGYIYHHASTQTPTENNKKAKDYSNLRTRETQTVETRTLSIQSYRESGTQMERIDLRLDDKRDVVKISKPYFTSEELLIKKKAAVIMMQRYWRGYRARCLAAERRQRLIDYQKDLADVKKREEEELQQQKIRDQLRRTHPKTNQDFAVLYNELDQWRKEEIVKIKTTIPDLEERRKAMAELLNNETKALQNLQLLKLSAQKELHHEKTEEMLKEMSQPLIWQLSHGEKAYVHTPETQRAKQLLDLFNALHQPLTNTDQRLETLLQVKWIVTEVDSPVSDEIKELVDRESDLISRNRPLNTMEKLRVRLSNLFLQFLQNPQFNPRAADFIKETSNNK